MDSIHIHNLVFPGKHGVYEQERKLEQEFLVDLILNTDLAKAGVSDDLADTIDYHRVKDIVRHIIVDTSSYLIEKVAQDIADAILKETVVDSVTVTVQKTTIWKDGIPGVTITRTKNVWLSRSALA